MYSSQSWAELRRARKVQLPRSWGYRQGGALRSSIHTRTCSFSVFKDFRFFLPYNKAVHVIRSTLLPRMQPLNLKRHMVKWKHRLTESDRDQGTLKPPSQIIMRLITTRIWKQIHRNLMQRSIQFEQNSFILWFPMIMIMMMVMLLFCLLNARKRERERIKVIHSARYKNGSFNEHRPSYYIE